VVIVRAKQSNDSSKVEGYFESHVPIHVPFPCIEVRIGLKDLATILPLPFVLVLIPFYVAHLLAFTQDLADLIIYDPFWIIYRPISYFLFLDSAMSISFGFLLKVESIIFWFLIHYNPSPILLRKKKKKKKICSLRYSNNV
jgi:hypothetical protein